MHSGRSGAALFYGRYLGRQEQPHVHAAAVCSGRDKLQRCARSEPSGKQLSSGELCNIIGWFCVCVIKIIPPVAYSVAWTTPGFLIPFLGSGANNIMALVIGFVCVGVSTLIYLPFVIASTKAALKAEGAENA